MKKNITFILTALFVAPLFAADSSPRDEITNAAKKLSEQSSYSWRTTVVVPEDAQFKPGPTDGKTEKDGFTWVSITIFDNKMESFFKLPKGVIKQEDEWKTLEEFDKEEGWARFPAAIIRNLRTPAKEVADLLAGAKELKKEGEVISADLTEEGARTCRLFAVLTAKVRAFRTPRARLSSGLRTAQWPSTNSS